MIRGLIKLLLGALVVVALAWLLSGRIGLTARCRSAPQAVALTHKASPEGATKVGDGFVNVAIDTAPLNDAGVGHDREAGGKYGEDRALGGPVSSVAADSKSHRI